MSWSLSLSLEIAAMFGDLSWRADEAQLALAERRTWRTEHDRRRRREHPELFRQYRLKYWLARKNDPEWLARERKRNRDLHRAKYWADAAYRERKRAASREYQRKKRSS